MTILYYKQCHNVTADTTIAINHITVTLPTTKLTATVTANTYHHQPPPRHGDLNCLSGSMLQILMKTDSCQLWPMPIPVVRR